LTSFGAKDHLTPVGNPAPPLPRSSDFLTSSIIQSFPLEMISLVSFQSPLTSAAGRLKLSSPYKFLNILFLSSSI